MMRNTSRTAVLAAALTLAAAPALASADDMASNGPMSPIALSNVQYHAENTPDVMGTYGPAWAELTYTNQTSQPATEVVFAVTNSDGQPVDFYDDTGTISPGVTIDRTFSSLELADPDHVAVARVTFADGSMWVNPAFGGVPEVSSNSGS